MSDEYHNAGLGDSLVNTSAVDPNARSDAATKNFAEPGDSTSSGGYGSAQNAFSDRVQRGRADASATGLVGPSEARNAAQGVDADARRDFQEQQGANWGLNPYGGGPDSRAEAQEMLASAYRDRRGEVYESGAAAGNDGDVGA